MGITLLTFVRDCASLRVKNLATEVFPLTFIKTGLSLIPDNQVALEDGRCTHYGFYVKINTSKVPEAQP